MDIPLSDAYLHSMFARIVSMFAVIAITAVTTVTSAHAVRMSVDPDHAVQVGETVQALHNSVLSCDGERHCGSADAGMCEFVCAGLSAFLTSTSEEAGHEYAPTSHDFPSGAIHVSRVPALNERPPKLRLL